MNIKSKLLLLLCLVFLCSIFSGCAYYRKSGGGSLTYQEASRFLPADTEGEWRKSSDRVRATGKAVKNYKANSYYSDYKRVMHPNKAVYLLLAFTTLTVYNSPELYFQPASEETPELFIDKDLFVGYLAPVFYSKNMYIDPNRSHAKAYSKTFALPLLPILYYYDHKIFPEEKDGSRSKKTVMRHMVSREPVELKKYFRLKSHTFLGGILGWGVNNHEKYFQFLWIPFKTGTEKYD